MGRDAMLAGAQDSMGPVETFERRAARTGCAFVATVTAGRAGVRFAEVSTSCPLQQVSAGGCHIAQLWRRARKNGLREHRVRFLYLGMPGEIGIAYHGPDAQASRWQGFNLVEGQQVDINEGGGLF